jgi:hypothetical protein
MAVAKLPAVERNVPEIGAVVLKRVKKATYSLFVRIKESKVFTTIDDLIASRLIFRASNKM